MREAAACLCAMLAFAASVFGADAPAPAPAKGFEAFRFVRTRNIFDPERRAMIQEANRPPPAPSRPESIALTGTMVAEGKRLAFFTGSRSDYNRVISIRDKIADCTVTGISSTHVDLERDGKPVVLVVGKQLALDASGAISAATPGEAPAAAVIAPPPSDAPAPPTGADGAPSPAPAAPAAAPAGDKAEVLRRMMERRQKEMSK